jgi:hypothetical protein
MEEEARMSDASDKPVVAGEMCKVCERRGLCRESCKGTAKHCRKFRRPKRRDHGYYSHNHSGRSAVEIDEYYYGDRAGPGYPGDYGDR